MRQPWQNDEMKVLMTHQCIISLKNKCMCSRNKSVRIVTHIHVITVGEPLILACICHINHLYVCGITVVMTILVGQKCLSQMSVTAATAPYRKSPSSKKSSIKISKPSALFDCVFLLVCEMVTKCF